MSKSEFCGCMAGPNDPDPNCKVCGGTGRGTQEPIGYCVWITPTKLAGCAKSAKGSFPVYAAAQTHTTIAMKTALRIIEDEIKAVEAKPASDFSSDYYGDPSVPGGTFSWSKKDEELHYLNKDADVLRASLTALEDTTHA